MIKFMNKTLEGTLYLLTLLVVAFVFSMVCSSFAAYAWQTYFHETIRFWEFESIIFLSSISAISTVAIARVI